MKGRQKRRKRRGRFGLDHMRPEFAGHAMYSKPTLEALIKAFRIDNSFSPAICTPHLCKTACNNPGPVEAGLPNSIVFGERAHITASGDPQRTRLPLDTDSASGAINPTGAGPCFVKKIAGARAAFACLRCHACLPP